MIDLSLNALKKTDVSADIKDTNITSFENDVLTASMQKPVIVDFWSQTCAPCKQLLPLLEKTVSATKGSVALVKINADENPELVQALRVQSIPAVFAFFQGNPVDGFVGLRPESEIVAFVAKLQAMGGNDNGSAQNEETIKNLMGEADGFFYDENFPAAMEKYSEIFDYDPENTEALSGIAWCLFMQGDIESVREMLEQTEEDNQDERMKGLSFILSLGSANNTKTLADLEKEIEKNEDDYAARYDLAHALAGAGDLAGAITQLIELMRRKRDWNEEKARKLLLSLFEAMGSQHPLTGQGRRQLSAILFS